MQCIYALEQSKEDSLEKQEKFLKLSINDMYVLYLQVLTLFKELHRLAEIHVHHSSKKYLSTEEDHYPNRAKFITNELLVQIVTNDALAKEIKRRKLNDWDLHTEYVKLIHKDIVDNDEYKAYMLEPTQSYDADRNLLITIFKKCIAPNEKIYDYFEDHKLTWVDDLPIVNTFLVKRFKKATSTSKPAYFLPSLLKDQEDMDFANQLLTKTLLNDAEWETEIEVKTPNWDNDRIAEIDSILLKMALCELLHFPSIPEKVTLNEYLEIAKEYSTPKSSIFINGILDKLAKEFKSSGRLQKIGRGLL